MEPQSSFNVSVAIQQWRDGLAASPAIRADGLAELESHLRDTMGRLIHAGLDEEEAFLVSAKRLGDTTALRREFEKSKPGAVWTSRLFWALSGILLLQFIAPLANIAGFLAFVIARHNLPLAQVHLGRIIGITVILGVGVSLSISLWWWFAQLRPRATPLLLRLLRQPVAVAFGMAVLLEGLHALDDASQRASAQGIHAPDADRSLIRLFYSTKGLIENIGAGHRPYGTGQVLYLLLQYTPEIALIVAFVFLAHRTVRQIQIASSLSREQ